MKKVIDLTFPQISIPVTTKVEGVPIVSVLLNVLLLCFVFFIIKQFKIESNTGINSLPFFLIPAYLLYIFIPLRFKPAVYVALFVICNYFAFGWLSGTVLLALLLIPFVIFSIPLAWNYKLLFAILFLCFMLVLRFDLLYMPRMNVVVPFVASILIFRLILLLYETKYANLYDNHWLNLAYLFSFNHLFFLLGPVVDYKVFVRSFYATNQRENTNRALWFLFSGVLLFVLHRISAAIFATDSITNLKTLIPFLIGNYLVVLKIVATLTFAVGCITIFGFHLPNPFGLFLFADSFKNYWRKVNVYWREFMMKLVYYPVYFEIRRKTRFAFFIALFSTFMLSWFFHWYQKTWITGIPSTSTTDFLFWLALGLLVAFTSNAEDVSVDNKPREKTFLQNIVRGFRVLLVFSVMSVLWLLWKSESVAEFFFLLSKGASVDFVAGIKIFSIVLVCVFAFASVSFFLQKRKTENLKQEHHTYAIVVLFSLILMLQFFYRNNESPKWLAAITQPEKVNTQEQEKNEAGYYESIMNTGANWEISLKRARRFNSLDQITIRTNDLLLQKFAPSKSLRYNEHLITTNSFGQRDKEYAFAKTDSTFRICLLGTSYELGMGVGDTEVFESITEEKLNAENDTRKIEMLNFSMGGYCVVQQFELMQQIVPSYTPDEIILFAHTDELRRFNNFFCRYIKNGTDLKYDFLKEIKQRAGVNQHQSRLEIKERLLPFMAEITTFCYQGIVEQCKMQNIKPVWIFLPTTSDLLTAEKIDEVKSLAVRAGFETYVLTKAYADANGRNIIMSETDTHPNKLGHFLIAQSFYNLLADSSNHLLDTALWTKNRSKPQ